jgi:hypothetical protein
VGAESSLSQSSLRRRFSRDPPSPPLQPVTPVTSLGKARETEDFSTRNKRAMLRLEKPRKPWGLLTCYGVTGLKRGKRVLSSYGLVTARKMVSVWRGWRCGPVERFIVTWTECESKARADVIPRSRRPRRRPPWRAAPYRRCRGRLERRSLNPAGLHRQSNVRCAAGRAEQSFSGEG